MKKIKIGLSLLLISGILLSFYYRSKQETLIAKNQMPSQWFYQQRAFPFDKINKQAYHNALKQAIQLQSNEKSSFQWTSVGPSNIGGRLTDVELNPQNPSQIYLGTASGGVYKSTNNGASYFPIFDESLSLSIGDIAISPSEPNVVYVGTGEANPGGGSMAYDGNGIYKSMDNGETWQQMGLNEIGSVGRIAVSPQDANIAYVAAMGYLFENNSDRGVFKTEDGGQNWDRILYLNDSTGAVDIAIHPQNTDTVYAAMWQRVRRLESYVYGGLSCGIYRSVNGGNSWEELSNGLPSGSNIGRIGIDISDSDPNVLYAIYADRTGYFLGLYKSEDAGNSWAQTNDNSLSNMYSSYGWWFGRLKIDPNNSQIVYAIGFDLYKTSNGGNTWSMISSSVHVDHHEVAISPENSNRVLLANDGGLFTSSSAGNSWTKQLNLPITQFYTCAIDASIPSRLYGGAQDNGTNRTLTGNADDWNSIYWGDGFYCLVDPLDNSFVYAEYQYGNFARSTNHGTSFSGATTGISSGDRKNWNTPVVMNPLNSKSLYYGANRLYKSVNRAANWQAISNDLTNGASSGNQNFGTISTITVSTADTNVIYVGTDDANVWMTQNNGLNWIKVSDDLPQRWISRVVADPSNANIAYVCLSGYRENDYLPHIFKTEDYGSTWFDVSQGLPEAPVNDLVIDPDQTNRLIVATDMGVYYTDENTNSWQSLDNGMPMVPITALVFHASTNKLVAATYGRSMYILDFTVGTEKITNTKTVSFVLSPNPASQNVLISFNNSKESYLLELMTMKGNILFSEKENNPQVNINLQELSISPGLYILKVSQHDVSQTKKLIIR